jgi:hypothetical protein
LEKSILLQVFAYEIDLQEKFIGLGGSDTVVQDRNIVIQVNTNFQNYINGILKAKRLPLAQNMKEVWQQKRIINLFKNN